MTESRRMEGKRVLVTGAGTGLGRGIALEFAREGAVVAIHYAHSDEGARSAVAEIRAAGGRAEAFQADLNSIDEVRGLAGRALEFLEGADVLVNNSGITVNKPFLETTPEQFDTLYNVNIRAMFFLTQEVVPKMLDQGKGAVINLTSVHAFSALTEHTVYAGTKGAIVAYTRVLAMELAHRGVRVNAIAPGWILVENHLKVLGDFDQEAAGRDIPAGHIGKPEDISRTAIFLASDDARYIVGQTVVVDGGLISLMPLMGDYREPRPEQWGQGYVPGL